MSDLSHEHAAEEHSHPAVPYFGIFMTLLVMSGITIAASWVSLGEKWVNVVTAFAIATFKASLVMMFFMHLKYERRLLVIVALVPFVLVTILILALFPDIVFGQYH